MPTLDMSDVLQSYELVDTISIVSTTGTYDGNGNAVLTQGGAITLSAIVVPGKISSQRLADGSRIAAFIDVYVQYPVTAGFKTSDAAFRIADTITWHGRQYAAMQVEDFSAFGAGWIHASCDLSTLNPPT